MFNEIFSLPAPAFLSGCSLSRALQFAVRRLLSFLLFGIEGCISGVNGCAAIAGEYILGLIIFGAVDDTRVILYVNISISTLFSCNRYYTI